jgi:hypothetical protein
MVGPRFGQASRAYEREALSCDRGIDGGHGGWESEQISAVPRGTVQFDE